MTVKIKIYEESQWSISKYMWICIGYNHKSEKMKEFFEREIQRYNKRKKTLSEHRLQSQQAITDNERNKNQILELEKIIRKKEKDITDLREIIEKQMVMLRRLSKQRGIKIQ
jgi:hypothetical protein